MTPTTPRFRLGIDLDGVLADFVKGFNKRVLLQTKKVMPAVATCWDWYRQAGVTEEEDKLLWKSIANDACFFKDLDPLPNAPDDLRLLTKLARDGHQVYFITTRPGAYAQIQSGDWLLMHGYRESPAVLLAGSPESKAQLATALKLDLFIDDRPENVQEVSKTDTRTFLLTTPYNTSMQVGPRNWGLAMSVTDMWNQIQAKQMGKVA